MYLKYFYPPDYEDIELQGWAWDGTAGPKDFCPRDFSPKPQKFQFKLTSITIAHEHDWQCG